MNIAVVNETSAGDKNRFIMEALENRGHRIINAGMKKSGGDPELTYIHTGLLSALLLNTGRADFVVGGCGTGQGYLNSVMQYPGVCCGLILDSLDAWLFTQINGGNTVSLALNKGFGWAADINLKFVFDRIFSVERGCGYPEHRKKSQAESREILSKISVAAHKPFHKILQEVPADIISAVLNFPGVMDILRPEELEVSETSEELIKLAKRYVK